MILARSRQWWNFGQYPLRDAAKAQDDFAARKTTGKVILKPFE